MICMVGSLSLCGSLRLVSSDVTNLEGGQQKDKEMNPEFLSCCVHVVLPSCLSLDLAASANAPPVSLEEKRGPTEYRCHQKVA